MTETKGKIDLPIFRRGKVRGLWALIMAGAVCCAVLPGCAVWRDLYTFKFKMIAPVEDTWEWSDGLTKWKFGIKNELCCVDLYVTNLSTSTIKLVWDDSSAVKEGQSFRIYNSETKDRSGSQIPTVIPPQATQYERLDVEGYGGLFTTQYNVESTEAKVQSLKGKTLKLYFVIEQDTLKKTYPFEFQVADVEKTALRPDQNSATENDDKNKK